MRGVIQRRTRAGAPAKVYPSAIVQPGARLGEDAVVGAFCFVADGAVVGNGTRIQSHVSVWRGVILGDDVFVGPSATFTNVRHPRAAFPRAPDFAETRVDDGATVGANAVIVAPVRIGACAVIAAGAVVTSDVAPHAVVAGSPARTIGWACTCGETVARGARCPRRVTCAACDRQLVKGRLGGGLSEGAAPPPGAR
jgi:UDP-2-acetamido-3-amino-2,3-dideoxy-glucuronate N-acetyltransferase